MCLACFCSTLYKLLLDYISETLTLICSTIIDSPLDYTRNCFTTTYVRLFLEKLKKHSSINCIYLSGYWVKLSLYRRCVEAILELLRKTREDSLPSIMFVFMCDVQPLYHGRRRQINRY